MKNNGMKPLNLDDGFEEIVNAQTSRNRAQKSNKVRRWLWLVVALLSAILLNMVLWLLNAIQTVPSLWITGICGAVACFTAGRLFESCNN